MKIRRAKLALLLLGLFLVTMVIVADSGEGGWLFALAGKIPAGDKAGHFLLFGPVAFLVNLLWRAATTRLLGVRVLKGTAIVLAVVALEECSQVFFRSRTFDLLDLSADVLGIWVCGRLAVGYLNWKRA
jgi:polysaccharide biosynthesis protein VpsQ